MNKPNWEMWKSFDIGTGLVTGADFRKALKTGGHRIGLWGNPFIDRPNLVVSETRRTVPTVLVSAAELGFSQFASPLDVLEKGQKTGLCLGPEELGFQVRLQWSQTVDQVIFVATRPISLGLGNDPHLFQIDRTDGETWLRGSHLPLGNLLPASTLYLFALPQ